MRKIQVGCNVKNELTSTSDACNSSIFFHLVVLGFCFLQGNGMFVNYLRGKIKLAMTLPNQYVYV